jgi:hypothetical protein
MSVVDIHDELCAVYGQNEKCEGVLRQWCRMLNMRNSKVFGQPLVVNGHQSVNKKICQRWHLTISELLCDFHKLHALFSTWLSQLKQARLSQVSSNVHYDNAHRWAKMQRTSQSHCTSNRWWNLNSFVNVEPKQQSQQWLHIHSPNTPQKFKQKSARNLMATASWDRKGVMMVEFMHKGTIIS